MSQDVGWLVQTLNITPSNSISPFIAQTTGCGVSQRILFEDKMRDGKNDLTDSELILPPQVRRFFLVSCIFYREANSV